MNSTKDLLITKTDKEFDAYLNEKMVSDPKQINRDLVVSEVIAFKILANN